MAFMILKQHSTKMFSRLFSANFTRSIYTPSQKILMYDTSLKLPYLVTQKIKQGKNIDQKIIPGENIEVLAPVKPDMLKERYKQGTLRHMSDELNKAGSTIDYAERFMDDPKFASKTYDVFVLHELILGKTMEGSTRTLEQMKSHVHDILDFAVNKLKTTPKEINLAFTRSEYENNCVDWNIDEIASRKGLGFICQTDLDLVEDKDANDKIKLSLSILRYHRVTWGNYDFGGYENQTVDVANGLEGEKPFVNGPQ